MKPMAILQGAMVALFLIALASMAAAGLLHIRQGDLSTEQATALLRVVYWGIYPLGFVALGAFMVHLVHFYTGHDA